MAIKQYFLPRSLDEAVALKAEHGPELLVMGGGTITMKLINEGHLRPAQVMGLRHVGLNGITANGQVTIGAMTSLSQLVADGSIPMLSQAAHSAAAWSLRNMATVGGNLFARNPYGDVAAALLALDASLKLVGSGGERIISLADFFAAGRALEPGELLTEIQVPRPTGQTVYHKFGRKAHNTPAVVTVAAHVTLDGGNVTAASIVLNGVAAQSLRVTSAEAALTGQPLTAESIAAAAQAAMAAVDPPSDPVASGWYRKKMVGVVLGRALQQIKEKES